MVPPSYSLLYAPLPSVRTLPDVRINKKVDVDHDQYLTRLGKLCKGFGSRRQFWIDVTILDRLHYKNINQHRHFSRFRRAAEARRLIKRFKSLQIDKIVTNFYLAFWDASNLQQCTGKWNYIPSKEFSEYTMHRLIAAALVLDKLQMVLIETYREHTTLLRLEHFVSLAVVYMSVTSRLYTLTHTWVKQIEECYDMLQKWHEAFPYGMKQKAQAAFFEKTNQKCSVSTFREAREKALKHASNERISSKHPIHLATEMILQSVQSQPTLMETAKSIAAEHGVEEQMDFEDLGEIIQRD
ncbi:uncharacterized protein BYT42DRAFT_556228 [Radiomyces spectabilis]|uniref:uncharacterized protein n=1 Tax=Radiomyces spectabilis TaxID=64574 RepID=UPI00221FBBFB|nr:uncharacterized protein BYT42DRAFT_556228 [Radiomyces spectabilis]KAI8391265.1 hypothetical protein BYT42DRAFT_556228 [Radiomyces spectabilis]